MERGKLRTLVGSLSAEEDSIPVHPEYPASKYTNRDAVNSAFEALSTRPRGARLHRCRIRSPHRWTEFLLQRGSCVRFPMYGELLEFLPISLIIPQLNDSISPSVH